MAQILLIRPDGSSGWQLSQLFGNRGHRVTTLDPQQPLAHLLEEIGQKLDLAILEMLSQTDDALGHLATLKLYRHSRGPRPMVLCVSSIYRGPRFELEIERQGARIVYVR